MAAVLVVIEYPLLRVGAEPGLAGAEWVSQGAPAVRLPERVYRRSVFDTLSTTKEQKG